MKRDTLPRLHLLALVILFFTHVPGSEGQAARMPTPFRFRARFQGSPGETWTLPMGALLRPVLKGKVEQGQPKIEFQPVVTCDDITLEFDETGISKRVEIQGFCYAPNFPTPPSGVDWVITGAFVQKVRLAGGCNPEDLRGGQLECRLPWCRKGKIWRVECPELPIECMRQFGEKTQRWFGKSLKKAAHDGLCITKTGLDDRLQQTQILECLADAKP